jgi:probable O-glycosylation ligase (exosortase A-associated)
MNGLIFTYALTYGGSIISIFNPFYGLLIYICFAILKPPALWPWAVPPANYSRIIGIAFLVGWALNGFGDGKLGRARPIVAALLCYFLWVVLSTMFGMAPERGAPFIEYLIKIILPFIAGLTLIHTWQQLRQLLWVILGSCAFLAYEVNLMYLHGVDVEHNPIFGIDNNSFSILMSLSFGLSLVLALEERVVWRQFMFFGFAAAMAHVPMLSMSRGGMLGVVAATGVAVLLAPKTRRTWMMIAAGAAVAMALAGPSVIEEFSTSFQPEEERDGSAESRILLWQDCLDTAKKNPVFGIGQECWQLVVESYGWPKNKEAHSLWFQTTAELGFPGVGFLLLFYYRSMTVPWRARRAGDTDWMPTVARMMMASLAGFCISASFVTVEGFVLPYYVVLLGACGVKMAYAQQAALALEDESDDAYDLSLAPPDWRRPWAPAH